MKYSPDLNLSFDPLIPLTPRTRAAITSARAINLQEFSTAWHVHARACVGHVQNSTAWHVHAHVHVPGARSRCIEKSWNFLVRAYAQLIVCTRST